VYKFQTCSKKISKTKQKQKKARRIGGYRKSRTNNFLKEDDKTIPNISTIPKIVYLPIKKTDCQFSFLFKNPAVYCL